jgi:hypothetical protein
VVSAEASAALAGITENAIYEASTVSFPPDRRDGYIYVAEAVSGRDEKASEDFYPRDSKKALWVTVVRACPLDNPA